LRRLDVGKLCLRDRALQTNLSGALNTAHPATGWARTAGRRQRVAHGVWRWFP